MQQVRQGFATARQVAAALGISSATVYRLGRLGELPSLRVGGSVRFDPDQVASFVKASNMRKDSSNASR